LEATAPYRGSVYDELAEPGELMTRMQGAGWDSETGIVELNHPMAEADFGRDLGWAITLGLDGTKDLPRTFDNTMPSLFLRTAPGSAFANSDYNCQEVMNGTENDVLLRYRAFWHYLLNQGVVRTGTANSDSHGLTDNVLGTPRNVVWSEATVATFDQHDVEFNDAIKAGHVLGTNGPLIEASMADDSGSSTRESRESSCTLFSLARWVHAVFTVIR